MRMNSHTVPKYVALLVTGGCKLIFRACTGSEVEHEYVVSVPSLRKLMKKKLDGFAPSELEEIML